MVTYIMSNSVNKQRVLTQVKLCRLISVQFSCSQSIFSMWEELPTCLGKGRKHGGNRRKCWLPAFSPFPTMFSQGFFLRVIKSRDSLVKVVLFDITHCGDAWTLPPPSKSSAYIHVVTCFRLLQQLLDLQKSYNDMLKKSIAEKKLQIEQLQ